MDVNFSEHLIAVRVRSEELVRSHRSRYQTQLHFLAGALSYYLHDPEKLGKVPEMKLAMKLLAPDGTAQMRQMLEELLCLLRDPSQKVEEAAGVTDCLEIAEVDAIGRQKDSVTVDDVIKVIFKWPIGPTRELLERYHPKPKPAEEKNTTAPKHPPRELSKILHPTQYIQQALLERVYGQDNAVAALLSGYFDAQAQYPIRRRAGKPMATFLFAGAPGVGKTFLAESAAELLKLPYRRFDMSSFADKEGYLEFSGTDKVYRNAHEGLVTGFVAKNPQCVLLFDEIEKAHPNIIHLFLQILDKATLKDSFTGENVSFTGAIIIMTTNAGRPLYEQNDYGSRTPSRKVVLNALARDINPITNAPYFPAAICSRFATGNVVMFNPLGPLDLMQIAQSRLDEYGENFRHYHRVELDIDSRLSAALLFAEGGKADARALRGRADTFIANEVYNWLKFANAANPFNVEKVESVEVRLDLGEDENGAAALFSPVEKTRVLLYSEQPEIYENFDKMDGFEGHENYEFFRATNPQEAKELLAEEEISLALCDITAPEYQNQLNIEDTPSSGRRMFETFLKEEIPFFIFLPAGVIVNAEERQALLEQGARGIFKRGFPLELLRQLDDARLELHFAQKLRDLSRANKVLTFDSAYEWGKTQKTGLIRLENLRISPAIDAEDQNEITDRPPADVTFDDVIGAESAKEELQDFMGYLRDPREYARHGIRAPKGVLLYGPPGTGKTMLAKALANMSGATFIATHGSQFLKGSVGASAAEVNRVFNMARKYAPSVLFIDEIDIVAKDRMGGTLVSVDEAVNALLNQMDGFSTNASRPVFVLAATNFDVGYGQRSALDPAVLRRFDRRIYVDLPDKDDRVQFIRARLKKSRMKMEANALKNIALRSTGMSLAELENVIDFALRGMLRNGKKVLTAAMLDEAFETYRFGDRTQWDESVLRRVAIHESGHALVSALCGRRPSYVTIAGRSSFGGYMQTEEEKAPVLTQQQLRNRICTALAGRAAETVLLGKEEGVTTGAASDLEGATAVANQMITVFGMSERHGLATVASTVNREKTLELCNEILAQEMARAEELIQQNREKMDRLVEALMAKNNLMGHEIQKILGE